MHKACQGQDDQKIQPKALRNWRWPVLNRKTLLIWEISGIFFLIIAGSLLHFVFEWSNRLPIIGIISPVNESVWEHLKLGFWSLLLFSVIEYRFIKNKTNDFFLAKGLGVFTVQGFILLVFYTYTAFSAKPILVIDISSYILGCVLCQVVSYIILTGTGDRTVFNRLGQALIVIHAVLLITFTFVPPKLPIFKDSHSLSYGIHMTKD